MGRLRAGGTPVLLLLLMSSCARGGDGVTGPTVPPGGDAATTSTAVTATTVSYEVPETIDQAYVQRVVSAYDKVLGDAIRVLKREGRVTDEFLEHLVGIYTEEEYEFAQKVWLEEAAAGRVAKTPESPEDPVTTVLAIIRADRECVVARAERDFTPTLVAGERPVESEQDDYVVLVPKAPDRDPASVNDTPWAMSFDGYKKDNTVPAEACDA